MITRERLAERFGITSGALSFVSAAEPETVGRMVVERLNFDTTESKRVRGILTRPVEARGPMPAILYAHAHGFDYDLGADEPLRGRVHLHTPLAPVFAAEGYVTLALDMPTFGTRQNPGEAAATKALLWHGRSLMGQMLSEQISGVDYLLTRDDVDPGRLWGFGLSMGATLTYWLAAIDRRLSAIAHLCCYADFRTMIALGAHDGHGFYLTVPGLLAETDNGEIAGLVAPRPQLICLGELDTLTPPLAVERALADTRAAYGPNGPLVVFHQPGVGHCETLEMRQLMLEFFRSLAR